MSVQKKKRPWLVQGTALLVFCAALTVLLMLGAVLVLKGWVVESKMNIIIIIAVFISSFISAKAISGAWNGAWLFGSAISAIMMCVLISLLALIAGEGSVKGLQMLENFSAIILGGLLSSFVQIRQKQRKKHRRKN